MIVNGIPASETLASFIASESIVILEITPLKDEGDADGTSYTICDPCNADQWSVYGRKADDTAILIHDLSDAPGPEIQWLRDHLNLPLRFLAQSVGSHVMKSTTELAEWLTETIHDEIPGVDDAADFRDDDFDNHALTPLRESLCLACGYNGDPIIYPEGASA